jgi:hypothetical protein
VRLQKRMSNAEKGQRERETDTNPTTVRTYLRSDFGFTLRGLRGLYSLTGSRQPASIDAFSQRTGDSRSEKNTEKGRIGEKRTVDRFSFESLSVVFLDNVCDLGVFLVDKDVLGAGVRLCNDASIVLEREMSGQRRWKTTHFTHADLLLELSAVGDRLADKDVERVALAGDEPEDLLLLLLLLLAKVLCVQRVRVSLDCGIDDVVRDSEDADRFVVWVRRNSEVELHRREQNQGKPGLAVAKEEEKENQKRAVWRLQNCNPRLRPRR